MIVPFRRAATTVRAVSAEAAALAGHLLLYPTGISQERWPLRRRPCTPRQNRPVAVPEVPPPCPARRTGPALDSCPRCPHLEARRACIRNTGCPLGLEAATAALPPQRRATAHPEPVEHSPAVHTPVILLHGLIDNRSVFTVLRRSLHRHGWQHVHALNYSPLTVDVRSAAVLLGRHVEHARRLHGEQRVALVGHSLGGLIARYYVQRLGGDEHVHTVVTLGSPHSGTLTARLPSPLPITRQLRPDSDLIRELRVPAPGCSTRFVAFWADMDQVVLPARHARLDHPDLDAENILVPGVGHLALPVHCDVVAGIRRALEGTGTAPGEEDGGDRRLTA